jgi:FkbM family methyltransferase
MPRRLGVLERLFGESLSRRGVVRVRTAGGVPWKLDLSDVTQRWIVYGDYEGAAQMNWCRRWLAGGGVMVDSGASIGQMLLHLAPLTGVRIIAFEPDPDSVRWLEECLALQPDWQVDTVSAALADSPGTLNLQVAGPHSTTRLEWYAGHENPRIQVPCLCLDDYSREHAVHRIRLWKLDMEGAEEKALAGASQLLSERRIDALLVEVSPQSWAPVRERLAQHGYQPARIGSGSRLVAAPHAVQGIQNRVFKPAP